MKRQKPCSDNESVPAFCPRTFFASVPLHYDCDISSTKKTASFQKWLRYSAARQHDQTTETLTTTNMVCFVYARKDEENHGELFCTCKTLCCLPSRSILLERCIKSCKFCELSACSECMQECGGCSELFCSFCLTQEYQGSYAQTICLDCCPTSFDMIMQ